MKVRIEFDNESDGEAKVRPRLDAESVYDVVEFTTEHAGNLDGWCSAVSDMANASSYMKAHIFLVTLLDYVHWEDFKPTVNKRRKEIRELCDYLLEILDEDNKQPENPE